MLNIFTSIYGQVVLFVSGPLIFWAVSSLSWSYEESSWKSIDADVYGIPACACLFQDSFLNKWIFSFFWINSV